jgi:hypothetical protein
MTPNLNFNFIVHVITLTEFYFSGSQSPKPQTTSVGLKELTHFVIEGEVLPFRRKSV